jgi:hypothetical protein
VFSAFFASLLLSFRSRTTLQLEILALRHQLGVLRRSVKRPKLTASDRLLWIGLSRMRTDWRSALVIDLRAGPSPRVPRVTFGALCGAWVYRYGDSNPGPVAENHVS